MSLRVLRKRIDAIDASILRLLNRRARAVAAVAGVKLAQGLPLRDPKRERDLLSRLLARNDGPLSPAAVERVFKGIISEFRGFEGERMRVRREKGLAVSVVGLGLIGGSLARALRSRTDHRLIGVIKRGSKVTGVMRACVHEVTSDPARACAADVVILAVPVAESIRLTRRWARYARPGSLWTDVGSVKAEVCRAAKAFLPEDVFFIGGHPMAGSARGGPANARPDLFEGATYALTPVRADAKALARLKDIIAVLGARSLVLPALEHDRLVAFTSHLPQFAASALAATALPALRGLGGRLAGPGLRDTTRLADSDAGIWKDIAALNRGNLRRALEVYMETLKKAANATPAGVTELFRRAHEARRSLFPG